MVALVEFPDTDAIAHAILRSELGARGIPEIWIGTKVPSPLPARFILCFTLPGREICRRTMWCQTITQVYGSLGTDEMWCSQTARLCGAILRAAPDIVVDGEQPVSEPCEMHGPFSSPDPELPAYERFQVNHTWTIGSRVIP